MKKKDEMLMSKTEMRMMRWIQCVSLRDHIRNEEIRKAATVHQITKHLMQKRLRWYGHVRPRDDSHMTRTMLDSAALGAVEAPGQHYYRKYIYVMSISMS